LRRFRARLITGVKKLKVEIKKIKNSFLILNKITKLVNNAVSEEANFNKKFIL